ncbi:MAG: hypothetical protein ACLSBL_02685 [Ezakiella massiliensis]
MGDKIKKYLIKICVRGRMPLNKNLMFEAGLFGPDKLDPTTQSVIKNYIHHTQKTDLQGKPVLYWEK